MARLTLRIDSEVVEQAKRIAAERKTTVSELVESYLRGLARESSETPIVSSLEGSLRGAEVGDYGRYLENKHS